MYPVYIEVLSMKKIIFTLAMMLIATQVWASEIPNLSAEDALVKLKQGNVRYEKLHLKHPDVSKSRRKELEQGQHPFVAILSCSDSRVPTEIIFDQGLGDIFSIRNAGNVLDKHVVGSIEYAVHHLGIKLVVVLGHESCGAVGAAMSESKEAPEIESLKEAILPACTKCKKENKYTYENVIRTHAKLEVSELLKDEHLSEMIKGHNVKIIPAYYNLHTGRVEFEY